MTENHSDYSLEQLLGSAETIHDTRLVGNSPEGQLPITEEMLLNEPSGNLFGMTQNAGMGWDPTAPATPSI